MLEINAQNLDQIKNPEFRKYAEIYTNIYDHFLSESAKNGLAYKSSEGDKIQDTKERLLKLGAIYRNDDKSIYTKWISPACEACRKGEDSLTFYLSLKCHRDCYYCFNPNQEDYDHFIKNRRNCIAELDSIAKSGRKLLFIALTGGEPLLHKKDSIEFFNYAKEKFPRAHTRLYTSGDLLDSDTLEKLKQAKLDEIRFSIKLEDEEELRRKVLDNMRLAKDYIPYTVVEMPVIPGTQKEMQELLEELNDIGISGINLLEFCFPNNNIEEFQKRSFTIKNPPFKVLYNYWYAGGLPVAGSEEECLELLEYALDRKLRIGVHYCSLENKHTGQVFQQNKENRSKLIHFSNKDFFLKTAKVFGEDISEVLKIFKKKKVTDYQINEDYNFLEFHIKDIRHLKKLPVEVGISSNVIEEREGEKYLRELKVELVYPDKFDMKML